MADQWVGHDVPAQLNSLGIAVLAVAQRADLPARLPPGERVRGRQGRDASSAYSLEIDGLPVLAGRNRKPDLGVLRSHQLAVMLEDDLRAVPGLQGNLSRSPIGSSGR